MSEAAMELLAIEARRFKPYPAYKDSGVEWLGKIPVHWEVKPFKTLLLRNDSGVWGDDFDDEGMIVLRSTEQTVNGNWVIEDPARRKLSVREASAAQLELHDLVVTKSSGSELHIGKTSIVDERVTGLRCCFSNFMQRLRIAPPNNPRLYWRLLNSPVAREQLVFLSSTTTGLGNLNGSILGAIRVPVASDSEQRSIAAFLDRETARIDALVAKKERVIELLQEKRTALITRAVTKGLDPKVPMKDSGVEWLGEIPGHWEVERIKWAARMESGHTPDKKVESYWVGGDIPWVSLGDTGQLREVDYIADTAVMTTSDGIAHSSAHILPAGTVVFSRDASIGLCAITRAGMAVSQHFIGWVCSARLQPEYLLFVLRSMTQELERLTMGATVRTIGMPDVRSLVTPIPPVPEQKRIVLHVQKNRSKIDALVAKVRDAIDRLKELRTALISAAVTGKIDVREEVS